MTEERLAHLIRAVESASDVLILPHNDPDPDAIASAIGLRCLLREKLGIESRIAYRGIVGRAENKALVRYLEHPLQRLKARDLRQAGAIALVDTQPGAGNNPLPTQAASTIVLDHHPWREMTASVAFADVRPDVGATSTILLEYLRVAGIDPSSSLATALFYGIKTDTLGLVRGASPADVEAYVALQPLVDLEALIAIERAQVPAEYFQRLDAALHSAQVYGSVIVSYAGPVRHPDLAAELADLFLRLRGIRWAICIGLYRDILVLSVRTQSGSLGAGQLAQAMVGERGTAGGHGTSAGGQVPLRGADPEQLGRELAQRGLERLGVPEDDAGQSLV